MPPRLTPKTIVDRLGQVRAQIADLQAREDMLRQLLIDSGETNVEGNLYKASVSTFQVKVVDYEGIVERIQPSGQMLRVYTHLVPRTTVLTKKRTAQNHH